MTIGEALFSFEGRMSRRDYWLKGAIYLLPIGLFSNYLVYGVGTDAALGLSMFIGFITLWPSLALTIKRLHDHDRSGWFLLTILIPLANIVFAIWIVAMTWFLRGTVGPNRYGDDPEQAVAAEPATGRQTQAPSALNASVTGPRQVIPVLKGINGIYAGNEIEMTDKIIIGRDAGMAQLIYPSSSDDISRRHCGISFDGKAGKFVLEDFSSNGTFLSSNERLTPGRPYYLNPGESFYLSNVNELFEVNFR